jgi:hypothetical protein
VLAQIGAWGVKWLPVSEELSIRAKLLEKGGPLLWDQLMAELRAEHLGTLDHRAKRNTAAVRTLIQTRSLRSIRTMTNA